MLLGCVLIGVSTLVNVLGVRLLSRINNVGVFAEMAGAVVLIVLLAVRARRGLGGGPGDAGPGRRPADGLPRPVPGRGAGPLVRDVRLRHGRGSLAEETDDPRRRAPRAILGSLAAVGLAGALLILGALRAAPDLSDPDLGRLGGGMPTIIKDVLGSGWGRLCSWPTWSWRSWSAP